MNITSHLNLTALITGLILIGVFTLFPFFSLFFLAVAVTGHLYLDRKKSSKPTQTIKVDMQKKRKYLASASWRNKREERLAIDNYTCQQLGCNSTTALNIHHITYSSLYNEPMKDLVTLCQSCHSKLHKEKGYSANKTYEISSLSTLEI